MEKLTKTISDRVGVICDELFKGRAFTMSRAIGKSSLPNLSVDLDFDHQFIPAHKYDAKYSYKGDYGYFPGWATVGGVFVGGENRDGNTNVKFHQADTLDRIMTSKNFPITINGGKKQLSKTF